MGPRACQDTVAARRKVPAPAGNRTPVSEELPLGTVLMCVNSRSAICKCDLSHPVSGTRTGHKAR